MGYVSFNRGFKSGGYNLLTPDNAFEPEKLDAYEAGLKTELFDRRLRLNIAGFYYNYSNQQVVISGNGTTITQNAASSQIYGIEGNLEARPVAGLTLASGISVMHGRYRNFGRRRQGCERKSAWTDGRHRQPYDQYADLGDLRLDQL